jgi:hypothetical protein
MAGACFACTVGFVRVDPPPTGAASTPAATTATLSAAESLRISPEREPASLAGSATGEALASFRGVDAEHAEALALAAQPDVDRVAVDDADDQAVALGSLGVVRAQRDPARADSHEEDEKCRKTPHRRGEWLRARISTRRFQ